MRGVTPLGETRDARNPAREQSREAVAHAAGAGNPPQPEIHEYEL